MAEESQDLLPDQQMPEPTVLGAEPRPQGMSCSRGGMFSAVSVFVALLIAGQAVTVYFVAQQHGQITKLKEFTTEMKLKLLTEQLPKGHNSPPKKLRMAMFNMPLAFVDTDQQHPVKRMNLTELENTAKTSSNIEDHVKYILAKENPQMMLPEYNDSLPENMKRLKDSMKDPEWKSFVSWTHQWLRFHSVQKPGEEDFMEDGEEMNPITEAPVLSKCQLEASSGSRRLLGTFFPKCSDNGDYLPMQCWRSTGFCWCVYKNGTEIPGTKTRAKLEDCSSIQDPEGSTLEPWMDDGTFHA